MFGGFFLAGLHVEEGEIGVNELLVRLEFLGFVAFSDGAGEVAFAVMGHAEGKLGVKVRWILSEDLLELGDGAIELPLREVEHGIVVEFL